MTEKKDSISETILRWGARKRARMEADSKMSFRTYAAKMLLVVAFIFIDGLFIPSLFQWLGLLAVQFVLPIAVALVAAAAVELSILSRIK